MPKIKKHKLETSRLYLQPIRLKNIFVFFKILADKKNTENYLTYTKNLLQAYKLIKQKKYFGVFNKKTNILVGIITFNAINKKNIQLSYIIKTDYQKQGYATEVLPLAIAFCFADLQAIRVEAFVLDTNKASIKLLSKFGFKPEGILRKYAYLENKAESQDVIMFSLLNSDIKKKK